MLRNFRTRSKSISDIETKQTTTSSSQPNAIFFKSFNINYDDSSDEEKVKRVEQYNIETCWNKCNKTEHHDRDLLANDNFLSFIAHAAGIKVLYHPEVNSRYYPLKVKLSDKNSQENATLRLQNLLKEATEDAIANTLLMLKRFVNIANSKNQSQKKFPLSIEKLKVELSPELNLMIKKQLALFISFIKASKTANPTTLDINDFKNELLRLVTSKLSKICDSEDSTTKRDVVKSDLFKLAKDKIFIILSDLKIRKNNNRDGHRAALLALEQSNDPYTNLRQVMTNLIIDKRANGHIENILIKQLANKQLQSDIVQAYIEDLINLINANKKSNYLSSFDNLLFSQYFTINTESLHDEITINLFANLEEKIVNVLKTFHRPTLGKNHLLASHNPYDFFANLRLSNCSQKRQAANLKYAIHCQDDVARIWHLYETACNETAVVETQHILGSSFGRKDMVEGIGSYEKVYDLIEQIKTYFKTKEKVVNDCEIAIWIRSIFQGSAPSFALNKTDQSILLHKLQSITYLLFGCEAVRNPAMCVINHMLLDLIIADGGWSFKEAFTSKSSTSNEMRIMPMTPKGAVSVARALESEYRLFMPYPYSYPGVEDNDRSDNQKINKADLIKSEAKIVRDWIAFKAVIPTQTEKKHLASWVLKLIENNFDYWFVPKQANKTENENFGYPIKRI